MSTTPSPPHSLNRLGVTLLIAALICWIGFHFLPIDSNSRGWDLWRDIWEMMTRGQRLQWQTMVGVSAFLMIAILVTASPFIAPLLRSFTAFRRLAIVTSGIALLGLGSLILDDSAKSSGVALLLAAMALNFTGLICIRPHIPHRRE